MSYNQQLAARLIDAFGGIVLFLAAIGLYAVMSSSVSQSTRDADGARRECRPSVTTRCLPRALSDNSRHGDRRGRRTRPHSFDHLLLYKVSPRDPIAFGSALRMITAVALVACFVPALRAARIDPARALRA